MVKKVTKILKKKNFVFGIILIGFFLSGISILSGRSIFNTQKGGYDIEDNGHFNKTIILADQTKIQIHSSDYVLDPCTGNKSSCGPTGKCVDCNEENSPEDPDCKWGDELWHFYYHCSGEVCKRDMLRSYTKTCDWNCDGNACTTGEDGQTCDNDGDCISGNCHWVSTGFWIWQGENRC